MTNQHAFYALENSNGETVSVNLSKTLRPELFAFLEKICRFDYRFNVVFRSLPALREANGARRSIARFPLARPNTGDAFAVTFTNFTA